ncbi:uncharacterized protein LOC122804983 [Protopterus annectens]|uniref:uncharacterized protein LOC122804983 n=1 Tax=Protopterus annectens TaxID=7888 RepID=UPI001CFBB78A|nr:uncharacterized protein LOC122804983 [Protopterus annectens]
MYCYFSNMKSHQALHFFILPSLLVLLLPFGCQGSQVKAARLHRWVTAGFQYLKSGSLCRPQRDSFLSETDCQRLAQVPQTEVLVYVSEPRPGEKVTIVLPDSGGSKSAAGSVARSFSRESEIGNHTGIMTEDTKQHRGSLPLSSSRVQKASYGVLRGSSPLLGGPTPAHDAVLALDPSPDASFGHPVLVFYIDFNVNEKKCELRDGVYLGHLECMTLALKNRCENLLKKRSGRSHRQGNKNRARRNPQLEEPEGSRNQEPEGSRNRVRREELLVGLCEIHFLPLVIGTKDPNKQQRLQCIEHRGFGPCPRPLPITSPSPVVETCELNKNTRRCHRQKLLSHKSCRMYQTCDHAVLISGGWQEQITYPRHENNIGNMYKMLQRNGFRKEHIKTFFAGDGQLAVEEEAADVFPAMEKVMIRSHISFLCRAPNCAGSLVLYLNSPTRNDGSMLLWDINKNGIADPKERYLVSELLADLENCNAKNVFLFIDQSYPGTLIKKLLSSSKHRNVALISAAQGSEFAWGSKFTEFWGTLQPDQCIINHLQKPGTLSPFSTPTMTEPSPGLLNISIHGAPCDIIPPLTDHELRRYMGCQNVPTMIWLKAIQRKEEKQN